MNEFMLALASTFGALRLTFYFLTRASTFVDFFPLAFLSSKSNFSNDLSASASISVFSDSDPDEEDDEDEDEPLDDEPLLEDSSVTSTLEQSGHVKSCSSKKLLLGFIGKSYLLLH